MDRSIDSYESFRGAYETQSQNRTLSGHGDIRSNGAVVLTGNGTVAGEVTAGGAVSMSGNSTVEGHVTAGADVVMGGNSGIDRGLQANGRLTRTENAEVEGEIVESAGKAVPKLVLPPIESAALASGNDDQAIEPGSALAPGAPPSLTVTGNDEVRMPPGVYLFKTLSIGGNATLSLGGPVMIFVTESLQIEGNGVVNPSQRPQDLVICYSGQAPAVIGANADLQGGIYAPSAEVAFTSNSEFFGGAVGKRVTISGNGSIHVDRDVSAIQTAPGQTPARTLK